MQEFATKTIREIALEAPLTTRVFEEYKIDFCCGGRVPFAEACEKAGVDPAIMMSKLEAVVDTARAEGVVAGDQRSPSELIDFIVTTHHAFTRDEFSRLLPLMYKVASKHGDNHPELLEIQKLFQELAADLMPHMQKEEMVLFPYIRKTEAAEAGSPLPFAPFGTVENPVRMMMFEHETAGDIGSIEVGKRADFALWEIARPADLSYAMGLNPCRWVVNAGVPRAPVVSWRD